MCDSGVILDASHSSELKGLITIYLACGPLSVCNTV